MQLARLLFHFMICHSNKCQECSWRDCQKRKNISCSSFAIGLPAKGPCCCSEHRRSLSVVPIFSCLHSPFMLGISSIHSATNSRFLAVGRSGSILCRCSLDRLACNCTRSKMLVHVQIPPYCTDRCLLLSCIVLGCLLNRPVT